MVLTGASRGVGRALALAFAAIGAEISLLGRGSAQMTETLALLEARKAKVRWFQCDLSDRTSTDAALERMGSAPEVLIHNAAVIHRAEVSHMSDASWDEQFETNVTAPFRITRALLPSMLRAGSGRILFVSSISALVGTKRQAAYNASKAALLGLMRCLAEEISDSGLATMALLPGSVDTRMLKGSSFSPRMTPEDVAQTVLFYALSGTAHNGAAVEMLGV